MNIEYLKLADGKTAVTDEKGKIKVIDDEVSGSKLLAENKIDIINDRIKEIERKYKNNKELSGLSRTMLLILPTIAILSILMGALAGGAYGALMCLIGVTGACVPTIGLFAITNHITKKKIKGYRGELKAAEELKNEANEITKKENNSIETNKNPINKPISLAAKNEIELPLLNKKLEEAYNIAVESQPKRLTRKRNK